MKLFLLVLLALPAGAGLLVLSAFALTNVHADRAGEDLCKWLAGGPGGLPRSLPEVGPQTRGLLYELRKDCPGCTCRVASSPHAESINERAIVVARGGKDVLGLRVGLTRSFTPLVLGFYTDKATK